MDILAVQQQLRAGGQIPQELIEVFSEEAEEHIRSIYDGLDRLRVELHDFTALADVRRSAHTLKGAAGAVGHVPIARLAHRMEDLLDSLFDHKQALTRNQLELLLVTTDHIQDLSLGEFDFDQMATSLLDVYCQYDRHFATCDSNQPKPASSLETAAVESLVFDPSQSIGDSPSASSPTDGQNALQPTHSMIDQLFGVGFEEEVAVDSHTRRLLGDNPGAHRDGSIVVSAAVATECMTETSHTNAESIGSGALEMQYLAVAFEQLNKGIDILPEIRAIFSEESQELLRAVYQGLDGLKQSPADRAALSEVRRSAHTLKGAAGAVGLEGVTRLAHRMEDLLDALAERQQPLTDSQLQTMLITADRIQDLISGHVDIVEVAQSMAQLYAQYDCEMQAFPAVAGEMALEPHVQVACESLEPVGIEGAPSTNLNAPSSSELTVDEVGQTSKPGSKSPETKSSSSSGQYLRVPLERIDGLVALVGEMVVNRSAMNQRLADFESRILDMQLVVNRFRAVSQEMEQSFGVEAMQQNARYRQPRPGKTATSPNGFAPINRIAAYAGAEHVNSTQNSVHAELDTLEFDRYTQLHLLARSIVEVTNDVAVISNEFRNIYGDIDSLIERQQRYNRDAQDGLMQIRMLPISSIVSRLERTVRTISNKLGKNVDLRVIGENTELDKSVLEEITDPLLHLIRNALDHGIETSEQRSAAGKPSRASLTLETLNQGTQVTIRVSDDGRGLDLARIHQKAVDQGLIQEQADISQDELHDLIFLPGFSTAKTLSDISGRGVGMDVVRDAVQRLKGTIRVESIAGKGATFTIHLPTSLSVTRALVVASSSHTFAIPMQSVEQIMRMDMVTTTRVGLQTFVNRDGKLLRLIDLAQHLEMRNEPIKDEVVAAQPVLLIRSGDNEIAVTVDAVKGGQDIVVKTLGDHLRNVPGYLGATLAGDGTVIPILDPSDLCGEKVEKRSSQFFKAHETKIKRRKTAMVIDDSLSVRRVASNLLRSHGWDVIDAKDGVDALEKLGMQDTPPDVFLCDMEMPRMDGLELIERLRGMSEFNSTPIVMVTSRSGEKHRRMAAEAGANEHVVKPFKDDQLIALIERMVSEHRELVGA